MAKELSKNFNAEEAEQRIYKHWMDKNYFHSTPDDREPYTIVIPPPNVTGVLHMGHMLDMTIQDVLIRKARKQGYNACWVPGTDHASIATEAKVVRKLREQGIKKSDLTRDEFLAHAWKWKDEHGGIIIEQLKKLGCSCDWERERFTLEEDLSDAVIEVFVKLFNKGLVYRGMRMINWDPAAKTALSNEEVIHKEEQSKLYFLKYNLEDASGDVTIATTRPETILGDSAICVNPDDDRYKHLIGKKALVPLINRAIPIIADKYVEVDFGTGCLKVTPAHDPNDYDLGEKHNLESINIFNDDATLNENAQLYVGQDRFVVKKQIVKDLEEKGHLVKVEEITNKVGYSERTDVVVEPRLSLQWYVKMDSLVKPALENVMNDNIQFFPSKFKNVYNHWMSNTRDWCISRQLWWGQQIPAYYYGEGDDDFVVTANPDDALAMAKEKSGNSALTANDLKRDEDALDTWFSSWLWPISVFDGFKDPENEEINYYYPTSVLVTGWDIMFFWVARMIMAGYEFKDELPFKEVFYHGMVRDMDRKKMSKSLGNSPDAIALLDKFGADGVRFGMLVCAPAGNDILFDEKHCLQGKNFVNKMWNALKLLNMWEVTEGKNEENNTAIEWFESKLNVAIESIDESFTQYRISEALMTLYTLIWDDFCSWYLEMIKPPYQQPIDSHTYNKTVELFGKLMSLLHPIMPFVTEEIWKELKEQGNDLIMEAWPTVGSKNQTLLSGAEVVKEVVSKIREIRTKQQIPNKEQLALFVDTDKHEIYEPFSAIIKKLGRLDSIEETKTEIPSAVNFISNNDNFYLETGQTVDPEVERKKLNEELDYTKGFIVSVEKKLGNEKFVSNAPEAVVAMEKKKLADGLEKIKLIEESLAKLN